MKYMAIIYFMVWVVGVPSHVSGKESPQPAVNTKYGRVLGTTLRRENRNPVHAFLSVPYAKPPVGVLRLALPEPVEPWEGDLNATDVGPICPQDHDGMKIYLKPYIHPDLPMSEDCLYLDIFSPDLNGKRAVFVFIHGGGFTVGKKGDISGVALAPEGDIVVVSINYRLGPLGFLPDANGNEPWPSNLGLRDQQFALRWVQENIAAFGGDPDRVTLGGESAGSISVSAHLLCPSSQGLFHRAIMQSGSIFTSASVTQPFAPLVLGMLGCDDLDADATMMCLRRKSVEEIVMSQAPPTVMGDDEMILRNHEQMYGDGKLQTVELLIGLTQNEGDHIATFVVPEMSSPEIDIEELKQQLGMVLGDYHGNNLPEIQKEIIDFYFGGDMSDKEPDFIRQNIGKIIGAVILDAPTHLTAQYHSDHVSNTYFYRFDYVASYLRGIRPSWHRGGCDHFFELVFTAGLPEDISDILPDGVQVTEEDIAVGKMASQYWANFIKTGNPNGEGLADWKPFDRQQENYMILNSVCEAATFFRPDEMAFWNTKVRNLGKASNKRDEL